MYLQQKQIIDYNLVGSYVQLWVQVGKYIDGFCLFVIAVCCHLT